MLYDFNDAAPRAGLLLLGAALALVALPVLAQDAPVSADVTAIAEAAAKYADVEVALAEGFVPDPSGMCVDAAEAGLPAEMGAMGIHYMHPGRLGITATDPEVDGTGIGTDFSQPAILLYVPQEDGSMRLVGMENLVFEAAWRAAGNSEPPMFEGRPWDYMADDPATAPHEAHGFKPHWDQHVWFVDNPMGNLMPFNPAVSCEHAAAHEH